MNTNKSKFDPVKFVGAGKRARPDRRIGQNGGGEPVSPKRAALATHSNVSVHHIIVAIRTLGDLYSDAAEMLDAQLERACLGPGLQELRSIPEPYSPSLDPSTFVDEEEDDEMRACPKSPSRR